MGRIIRCKIININNPNCKQLKQGEKFHFEKQWWVVDKIEEDVDPNYILAYCTETTGEVVWASETKKSSSRKKKED